MIGGVQTFILIAALQSYGFTAGPFSSYAECEAARGVVLRELTKMKRPFVTFCLPSAVEEKK